MPQSYHDISHLSSCIYHLLCALGLVCFFTSCHWHEAKNVIATADSLDQTEHVIYDDTAALGRAIRSLDNPFGRLFQRNTLGKAYYYMGRNLSMSNQIAEAAECYIEADRLQIDDPIYRGRVNSCMGYICAQNNNDSLALIFYERASEDFKESKNEWRYAQSLLDRIEFNVKLLNYVVADSLLQIAQSYQLDSSYQARYYETKGLYFYEQQQHDSALVYFQKGLDYWQSKKDKCFSWLKMMQIYFHTNQMDNALFYSNLLISTSNNPNYLSNAYYCLLLDAQKQNDAERMSEYTHARSDAQKLLRNHTNQYSYEMIVGNGLWKVAGIGKGENYDVTDRGIRVHYASYDFNNWKSFSANTQGCFVVNYASPVRNGKFRWIGKSSKEASIYFQRLLGGVDYNYNNRVGAKFNNGISKKFILKTK